MILQWGACQVHLFPESQKDIQNLLLLQWNIHNTKKDACQARVIFKKGCYLPLYASSTKIIYKVWKVNIGYRATPSLPIDASEKDIRGEICDVIKSTDEFKDVTPEDFEFRNMCGKQGTIPQCKEGFEWNGRSVKELAGSGSVSVRLLRNFEVVK